MEEIKANMSRKLDDLLNETQDAYGYLEWCRRLYMMDIWYCDGSVEFVETASNTIERRINGRTTEEYSANHYIRQVLDAIESKSHFLDDCLRLQHELQQMETCLQNFRNNWVNR